MNTTDVQRIQQRGLYLDELEKGAIYAHRPGGH